MNGESLAAAVDRLDPLLGGMDTAPPRSLGEPLTPLPPPMVPEVLPSAKVAAVKAVATRGFLFFSGLRAVFCPKRIKPIFGFPSDFPRLWRQETPANPPKLA